MRVFVIICISLLICGCSSFADNVNSGTGAVANAAADEVSSNITNSSGDGCDSSVPPAPQSGCTNACVNGSWQQVCAGSN